MSLFRLIPSLCALIISAHAACAAEPEAHHGAGAGGHAESGGLPQLDFSTWPSQIFWLIIFFVFLYAFFSRKTLPEISLVLENRQQYIENDIETAEKLRNEAETVHKAYEENLAKAKKQAAESFVESDGQIQEMNQKTLHDFQSRSAHEIAVMEKRLKDVKDSVKEEMNSIAAETASLIAEKIIGISPDPAQARDAVQAVNDNARAA